MLALDFDSTLVDVHTGSYWREGPENLSHHVRPFFRELIPTVLRKNILVCIVTFSSQRRLIQQTMRETFGRTIAKQILIRGSDGSWAPSPIECAPKSWYPCSRRGKADHVLSLVTKIYADSGVEVAPAQILLLDDMEANVTEARLDGMFAFRYNPENPTHGEASEGNELFRELMNAFRKNPLKKIPIPSAAEMRNGDWRVLDSPPNLTVGNGQLAKSVLRQRERPQDMESRGSTASESIVDSDHFLLMDDQNRDAFSSRISRFQNDDQDDWEDCDSEIESKVLFTHHRIWRNDSPGSSGSTRRRCVPVAVQCTLM